MSNVIHEFLANYVFSQNDGTVVMVGFADQQHQTKDCVLLQRTLNPSKSDKARKWDDVHIMVNDESCSAYGGINELELWPDHVLIKLTSETAKQVQAGVSLRINLMARAANLAELRDMLKVLCGGYVKLNLHV
jgi:hypothetical protein